MKNIYASMALTEQVLDSYLLRVFKGKLITKKTCKVVYFPEQNLNSTKGWNKKWFKDFCQTTVNNKNDLHIYKAKIKTKNYKKYDN